MMVSDDVAVVAVAVDIVAAVDNEMTMLLSIQSMTFAFALLLVAC